MIEKSSVDWPAYIVGTIAFLNLIVFGYLQFHPESLVNLAYFPSEAADKLLRGEFKEVLFRYMTSLFTHQEMSHFLGNIIPLYFVGVDVSRKKGLPLFFCVYFLGGIFANLSQTVFGFWIDYPAIGASGAVAALFGYYFYIALSEMDATVIHRIWIVPSFASALLIVAGIFNSNLELFPQAASLLCAILFVSGMFQQPRFYFWCTGIILWLEMNLYDLFMTSIGIYQSGSAHVAHIFGVIAGLSIAYLLKKQFDLKNTA